MSAEHAGFPLLLDVSGRPVAVVGAGRVGARRARALLDAGADVRLIAPEIGPELAGLPLEILRREFRPDDLEGMWLAFACTSDPQANAAIAEAAQARRIFCVRADAASGGTARTPAVARRGPFTVAVNAGDDPRRAAGLRDRISAALDVGDLQARPTRAAPRGEVVLVGGGPGDPELITVRGRRLVADADVVVVDRLAPRELLGTLGEDVEVVDCGKSPHRHNLTQAEINEVLVDRARRGKRVVRLKGGDPFVFGRGGEEWLACVSAGVPVTVVPGITSALAAPAVAGIPVTHRGLAAEFTVVSGHRDPRAPGAAHAGGGPDYKALAGADTLVLLMAMDRLDPIVAELIAAGADPRTPAAAVRSATLPGQAVVRAALKDLPEAVREAGLGAPAVVVIGAVVDVLPASP